MLRKILDFLWPLCPSGLPHRQRLEMVRNTKGHAFCWHKDCIQASMDDVADLMECDCRGKLLDSCRGRADCKVVKGMIKRRMCLAQKTGE